MQVQSIRSIADPTNLLALNAAIEEITRVVEQNQQLASQAGTVIIEIQDSAQRVVNAVGQFANQLST